MLVMDTMVGQETVTTCSVQKRNTESGTENILTCLECEYSHVVDDVNESYYCSQHNAYIKHKECICSKFLKTIKQ